MIRVASPLYITIMACTAAFTTPALADGSATSQNKAALPGVDGNYRIVRPVAPEPDDQPDNVPGSQFKIGNMDVRIGGSVTVDVGAGSVPLPRHK